MQLARPISPHAGKDRKKTLRVGIKKQRMILTGQKTRWAKRTLTRGRQICLMLSKQRMIDMANPEDDAKGQYAPYQADKKASGVHSAKPNVITGSEDATIVSHGMV
ncbi:hypothetical protein D3C71_1558310 [compost metagenome]